MNLDGEQTAWLVGLIAVFSLVGMLEFAVDFIFRASRSGRGEHDGSGDL